MFPLVHGDPAMAPLYSVQAEMKDQLGCYASQATKMKKKFRIQILGGVGSWEMSH